MASVCFSVISLSSVAALLPPSVSLRLEQVEQQGRFLTLTACSTQEVFDRVCHACASCVYPKLLRNLPQNFDLERQVGGSFRRFHRTEQCIGSRVVETLIRIQDARQPIAIEISMLQLEVGPVAKRFIDFTQLFMRHRHIMHQVAQSPAVDRRFGANPTTLDVTHRTGQHS